MPTTGGKRFVKPDKAEEDSPPSDRRHKKIPETRTLAPLFNVLIETKMARRTKETIKLLEMLSFWRAQSYKAQLMMGLPKLPRAFFERDP